MYNAVLLGTVAPKVLWWYQCSHQKSISGNGVLRVLFARRRSLRVSGVLHSRQWAAVVLIMIYICTRPWAINASLVISA